MIRILRVGDPHVKVNNIKESRSLIEFVARMAAENKVNRIEILGDLFHTHAVLRLEVVDFWVWAFEKLTQICEVVVLVGNHDLSGDFNSNSSALSVFSLMGLKNLTVVEKPTLIGNIGYIQYVHDSSDFIMRSTALAGRGAKVIVCHQTIQGSKYESGMYAPDGIPTGEWSERFVHIISGHIHSEQSFGNIIYPGTARWDSAVDANRRKGIWIYDHELSSGRIIGASFISTEHVCSPIRSVVFTEGDTVAVSWPQAARVAVELVGSSVWCSQQKEILKGKCSISTKITDKQKAVSRSPGNSLEYFLKNAFVSTLDRDAVIKFAREMGIV